jgi:Leucine-rich repeat (LRR) protein
LDGNQFTGTLPTELGQLSQSMTYLFAQFNQLLGPLLSEIGHLTLLEELSLDGNQFTGILPTKLGKLSQSMTDLWAQLNQLSGPLPSEIGHLTLLENLALGINNLTGTIPSEFASLTDLTTVTLNSNELTGMADSTLCHQEGNQMRQYIGLYTDCYGPSPEITCSCCTVCCDDTGCWDL